MEATILSGRLEGGNVVLTLRLVMPASAILNPGFVLRRLEEATLPASCPEADMHAQVEPDEYQPLRMEGR